MKEVTLVLSDGINLPWTADLSTEHIKISHQPFLKLSEFLLRTKTFFRIIEFTIVGIKIDSVETLYNKPRKVVIVEDYDSQGKGGLRLVVDSDNHPLIKT